MMGVKSRGKYTYWTVKSKGEVYLMSSLKESIKKVFGVKETILFVLAIISLVLAIAFTESSVVAIDIEDESQVSFEDNKKLMFSEANLGTYQITAYCCCEKCCGEWSQPADKATTSIGAKAVAGSTIAVDPSVIPYGTKVHIEGLGVFIATDCGGAIKGKHIDMYFNSHSEALQFGTQYRNVKVITEVL